MAIERFKMKFGHLVDDVDGNYVKYEDHEKAVEALKNLIVTQYKVIENLEDEIDGLVERIGF